MNRTYTQFLIISYLVLGTLFIFSSCSYKQDQILFEQKAAITDTTKTQDTTSIANYHIKPQDILQIRNLQNMQYVIGDMPTEAGAAAGSSAATYSQGQTYQVEEDGNIAMPVIGRVKVSGLTRIEASRKIEALYHEKLLKDPIIEVKITNLVVTVLGETKIQGNFPLLKDRTTLVEMVGEAGGLTDKANEKNVKIIRGNPKNPQVTVVDLSDINSLSNPATILKNGDIIYVAQNKRAIRTDHLSFFTTVIQPVILIINTALIIFTLARH